MQESRTASLQPSFIAGPAAFAARETTKQNTCLSRALTGEANPKKLTIIAGQIRIRGCGHASPAISDPDRACNAAQDGKRSLSIAARQPTQMMKEFAAYPYARCVTFGQNIQIDAYGFDWERDATL